VAVQFFFVALEEFGVLTGEVEEGHQRCWRCSAHTCGFKQWRTISQVSINVHYDIRQHDTRWLNWILEFWVLTLTKLRARLFLTICIQVQWVLLELSVVLSALGTLTLVTSATLSSTRSIFATSEYRTFTFSSRTWAISHELLHRGSMYGQPYAPPQLPGCSHFVTGDKCICQTPKCLHVEGAHPHSFLHLWHNGLCVCSSWCLLFITNKCYPLIEYDISPVWRVVARLARPPSPPRTWDEGRLAMAR